MPLQPSTTPLQSSQTETPAFVGRPIRMLLTVPYLRRRIQYSGNASSTVERWKRALLPTYLFLQFRDHSGGPHHYLQGRPLRRDQWRSLFGHD